MHMSVVFWSALLLHALHLSAEDVTASSKHFVQTRTNRVFLCLVKSCRGALRIEWGVGHPHPMKDDGEFASNCNASLTPSFGSDEFEAPGL